MNEQDYYRAFGLTPPEEEAEDEKEREPVEPAPEQEDPQSEPGDGESPAVIEEGENEPEPAEPAEEEEEPGSEEPPAQTRAERARQAAARREREQAAAIEAALQEERARTDEEIKTVFGWAGFKNGTKPIESLEDMRAYMREVEASRLEENLKNGKLTPDALRDMIRQEMQAEPPVPPPPAVDPAAFERQIQTELAEIRKYDPNVQSVEDFRNLDRAEAFFREVTEHGHSFADAYKFVYADRIAEAKARQAEAAGAQRAMNSARSKDHLRPSDARGGGDVAVPAETLKVYRQLMPKATDEEIRKAYNKYIKSTSKQR